MDEARIGRFAVGMMELRARYPTAHFNEQSWGQSLTVYYDETEPYPEDLVLLSLKRAGPVYPGRFPSLDQLILVLKPLEKTLAGRQHLRAHPPLLTISHSSDGPLGKLADAMEAEQAAHSFDRSKAAARASEIAASMGADDMAEALGRQGPPPNADDFCEGCGLLKLNHGIFDEGCPHRYGSELEPPADAAETQGDEP